MNTNRPGRKIVHSSLKTLVVLLLIFVDLLAIAAYIIATRLHFVLK